MRPGATVVALTAVLAVSGTKPATAQTASLTGYAQNVAGLSDDAAFADGGVSDFTRLRAMLSADLRRIHLDVAYEHTFVVCSNDAGEAGTFLSTASGNWLEMDWTVDESDDVVWAHRFDRAAVSLEGSDFEVTAGRQVVSWASTLLFTPADPFIPFDPTDPFREYRAGVDGVRARWFPGAFSELDLVVRPTRGVEEDRITALARAKTNVSGWDLAGWGGVLYDRAAVAGALVGELGGWAFRTEASVRFEEDQTAFRGAVGIDRRFTLWARDLFLAFEYQRDDFGATDGEISDLVASPAAQRGELQALSRDALALQGNLQLHPLVATDALVLLSLNDGSMLLAPGMGWSATGSLSVRAGVFVGVGDEEVGTITTEYGSVPTSLYLAGSLYF